MEAKESVRIRQAKFRAKKRALGMTEFRLWVTPEERDIFEMVRANLPALLAYYERQKGRDPQPS